MSTQSAPQSNLNKCNAMHAAAAIRAPSKSRSNIDKLSEMGMSPGAIDEDLKIMSIIFKCTVDKGYSLFNLLRRMQYLIVE